MSGALVQER
jgi:hypothetical protein